MHTLNAQIATTLEDRELNYFTVAFNAEPSGDGEDFSIQIALEMDEQARRLGLDTYCLCVESGATHYGGVESWEMMPGEVRFRLSEAASTGLGLDRDLTVKFPTDKTDEIGRGLARVLGP